MKAELYYAEWIELYTLAGHPGFMTLHEMAFDWNAAAREASFTDGAKTICFPIGSSTARTETGATLQMDTAAVIVNDRTYAPVRCLAKYFGRSVDWDGASRTVIIR